MIYLKILSRLGYFICVSPKYDFKTANISISKWHDLYAIFTTISAIIICILIFATNPIYRIPNIQITGKLLHIGYCACITGAMASALLTPLLQSKTWKKLLNNIQTLERIFFGMNVSHGQTYKHVSWKLFFLYLTIFVKDTYVIVCTWMKTPELYKYLLYTELYKYYTYTPLIIYIRINSIMKDKYKFIGCLLEKSTLQYISSTKNKIATIDFRQNKNVFRLKVKLMKRAYKTLNDTVNAHNSIFGFQIFFTVGYTFLRNLERFSGSLSVKRKENTTIFNQHDRPSYFWATQIAALSNVVRIAITIIYSIRYKNI